MSASSSRRRRRFAGLSLLALAGLAITTSYRAAGPPAHASRLAGLSGAGVTGIQVVNLHPTAAMRASLDFYAQRGGPPVRVEAQGVPPLSAANVYLPTQASLSNGAYAVVARTDRPQAVLARTDWYSSGASTIYEAAASGTMVVVPLAAKGFRGHMSLVTLQNTDADAAASVRVDLIPSGAAAAIASTTHAIGPGASITLDLGKHPAFLAAPMGFVGTLLATSSSRLAAQSVIDVETSARAAYAFNGVPEDGGAATQHIPRFRSHDPASGAAGAPRNSTLIAVANPGAAGVEVRVTYIGLGGACAGQTAVHGDRSFAIPPRSNLVFDQGAGARDLPTGPSGLPAGCWGTAKAEATGGTVAAVVVDLQADNAGAGILAAGAYNAFGEADSATTVHLPLYRREHTQSGLTTDVTVLNLGGAPAVVQLAMRDRLGSPVPCGAPCQATVPPGAAKVWRPEDTTFPSNAYGSAAIESDHPIVAVVDDVSRVGTFDTATFRVAAGAVDPPDAPLEPPAVSRLPLVLRAAGEPARPTRDISTPPTAPPTADPRTPAAAPTRTPAPIAAGPKDTGATGVVVANLHPADPATLRLGLTGADGRAAGPITRAGVAPGGPGYVYLPAEPSVGQGVFGGILTGDRPAAGMSLTNWHASASAAAVEDAAAATDVVLPYAVKGAGGQNTLVAVQNVDPDTEAAVTITLAGGAGTLAASLERTIAPGAPLILDLGREPDLAGIPMGFEGTLRVRAATRVAVQAFVDVEHSPMGIYGFNGEPAVAAADTLYAPLVRAGVPVDPATPAAGLSITRIAVASPGANAAQVTVAYLGFGGSCAGRVVVHGGGPVAVPPGGMRVFDAAAGSGLPPGCLASARITSAGGGILGAVVETVQAADLVRTAAAYNAFSAGQAARRTLLPLFRRQHTSILLSTDVALMNLGSGSAGVTLTLFDSGGRAIPCAEGCAARIDAGGTHWFVPETVSAIGANTYGWALVESDQPLAVVVAEASRVLRHDAYLYRGMSLDVPAGGMVAQARALPILIQNAVLRRPGPPLTPFVPPAAPPPDPSPLALVPVVERLYLPLAFGRAE